MFNNLYRRRYSLYLCFQSSTYQRRGSLYVWIVWFVEWLTIWRPPLTTSNNRVVGHEKGVRGDITRETDPPAVGSTARGEHAWPWSAGLSAGLASLQQCQFRVYSDDPVNKFSVGAVFYYRDLLRFSLLMT